MPDQNQAPDSPQDYSEVLEQYRILTENIVEGVIITDFQGNVFFANDPILNLMAVPADSHKNPPNVFEVIAPEDKARVTRDFIKVWRDGGRFLAEYKVKTLDGRELWIETLGKKIFFRGQEACFNVIRDITDRHQAHAQLQHKNSELEKRIHERTCELAAVNQALQKGLDNLEQSLKKTIYTLAFAVEKRDPYKADHQAKVSKLAGAIAKQMGLSQDYTEGVRMMAIVHDIGKIYLPAEILSKPTKLNEIELSLIHAHSEAGYDILKAIDFPWPLAEAIYEHHERLDGTGYPQGLKGNNILLEARILAVADVVEAMASHRPYRPALGEERALEEIQLNRGRLYDAEVVDVCCYLFRKNNFNWAEN